MRVITIGTAPQCDLRIIISPTLSSDISNNLQPVHCQIILLDNGEYRLVPFSDYIYINGCSVTAPMFDKNRFIKNKEIKLDFEDRLDIGIELYWQQWFYGYALNCKNCIYNSMKSCPIDKFCDYCKSTGYNPPPMMRGFSVYFNGAHEFFNYSCENCSYLDRHFKVRCIECIWHHDPFPKFNSWKKHIAMYESRTKR